MNNVSLYSIVYLSLAIISLLIIFYYLKSFKSEIDKDSMSLFFAVFVIIFGHFLISISKNVMFAINANRLVYLGNICLLIEMYIIISEFCGSYNKMLIYITIIMSIFVYLLVLTGGTNITLYYKSVTLLSENNLSIIVKEYGPLHIVYSIYVFFVFVLMFVKIVYSIIKSKVKVYINPLVLVLLGSENLFVWLVERILNSKLELLAVSYIITEILLLLLLKNASDYKKINENIKNEKSVDIIINEWVNDYSLTSREEEILKLLINNISRVDIANKLYISEHTVKKHTANLYEKLCVTSRNELLYKLNEELSK